MRDAVNLKKAGRPVVLFVHDKFERAARAQAQGLGASDLKVYVFPQYEPGGISAEAEEKKAARAAEDFVKLLLA